MSPNIQQILNAVSNFNINKEDLVILLAEDFFSQFNGLLKSYGVDFLIIKTLEKYKNTFSLYDDEMTKDILISIKDISFSKTSYEGTKYATVTRCRLNGSTVAVKLFDDKEMGKENVEKFIKDTELVKKILHPNIVMFLGIVNEGKKVGIVTEEEACNLNMYLFEKEKCPKIFQEELDLIKKMSIIKGISVGLSWIHDVANVEHGDLHDKNILFDKDGNVKLCDFGYGFNSITKKEGDKYIRLHGNDFIAPETAKNSVVTKESDIYAFGLLMYEIITRKRTFYNGVDPATAVLKGIKPPLDEIENEEIKNLITSCLDSDPAKRPKISNIMNVMDDIIIDVSMTCEDAIQFWKKYMKEGTTIIYEVKFDDIIEFIIRITIKGVSKKSLSVLSKYFNEKGTVTPHEFDLVCRLFGSFFKEIFIANEMIDS